MKTNPLEIRHLEITNEVLEYLRPTPTDPYTRLEAYFDLLQRAINYQARVTRIGRVFNLTPGEFVITITELADQWQWARRTVRKFIDRLCALGQLAVTNYLKCTQVDVISLRFRWADPKETFPLGHGYARRDGAVITDQDGISETCYPPVGLPVSGTPSTSPFLDEDHNQVYTDAQRREILEMSTKIIDRERLERIWSLSLEKALLDLLHVRCGGDEIAFWSALNEIHASTMPVDVRYYENASMDILEAIDRRVITKAKTIDLAGLRPLNDAPLAPTEVSPLNDASE